MRVPVAAAALCLAPALVSSQSLGDAARQQSRQRAERPPTARVYTDVDLRSGTDAAAAEVTGPSSVSAEGDGAAPPPPPEASGAPVETEATVRARLDREAAERRERESRWRGLARYTRARLQIARREQDVACGPGALVLAGG
jgi:hypothetical protein